MALTTGSRIGPYEIVAPLGVGGMGEVYRATDTKLKRQVAIKILAPPLAADADRLARFQREAEVLASLNHPSIAAIYGLEESAGITALVMELVEGDDLSQRITRGAIPLDEALAIARQIADALDAAHAQGIIHRDLKPANIKVRADGTVKILDYGLAKAMEPAAGSSSSVSMTLTIATPAMTQAGMILGTPGYMSPEQARGKEVDKRADIWAFGCVLYEMLTARSPFAGETVSDTIAKILEREPDWQALPSSTPAKIRDLLRRCLEKQQPRRLQDIADARVELEEARTALNGRRRLIGLPVVAAGLALAVTILAGAWWYAWRSIPPVPHEPVSVLIADLENRTGDPTFDHTLESVLKLALEGAGFISAYDRTGVRSLGAQAPDQLDERTAMAIAVRLGVGVVISGVVDRQTNDYVLTVKATETVTGNVVANATNRASSKDQVMAAVTNLVTAVRTALGDTTSKSKIFSRDTLSATSLDVVRQYAVATQALSEAKYDEALHGFSRAVQLDPTFGMGYQGLALVSRNLDRPQDAEKYIKEALRHVDTMTERERYRARGFFYRLTGDYPACVKEYGDLIARYAADVAAHNQLALCSTFLRQMSTAVEEMRRAVKIVPKSAILRINLALYESYSGDFDAGDREARAVQEPRVFGVLALAFAQLGQGRFSEASATYQKLATLGPQGASYAASGLGDLAVYEGRFANGVQILEDGAAADSKGNSPDRAAAKYTSLAYIHVLQGQKALAIAAAEKALTNSKTVRTRFLSARSLVDAGELARARTIAAGLASELQAEPRAHGRIIEGLALLKSGDPRSAIAVLNDANALLDTWIGHFDLGRVYFEAGQFAQADSEFDRCIKRRGEALAVFLDEVPTFGYFPPIYYYQGRAREGLNSAGFADSYLTYLTFRGKSTEDPLVPEVRRRVIR